jgi:hypothetical protein
MALLDELSVPHYYHTLGGRSAGILPAAFEIGKIGAG